MGPFLLLLMLISCGEKRDVRPGVTSRSELIKIMGDPLRSNSVPSGEVLTYPRDESFQITNDKVTAAFRNPGGDESTVLFWRHAFRECETTEKELNQDKIPEIELACPKLGRSVVFLKGSGKVIRVNDYEVR